MMWLLMIPLSGIFGITFGQKGKIHKESTHNAEMNVLDMNNIPVENVKVSLTIYKFNDDSVADFEKIYGFTDRSGYCRLDLAAESYIPNDTQSVFMISRVEDSVYCAVANAGDTTYSSQSLQSNFQVMSKEEYLKIESTKENVFTESTNHRVIITVKDQSDNVLNGVEVKLRLIHAPDWLECSGNSYYKEITGTTSPTGICTLNLSANWYVISGGSFGHPTIYYPHILQISVPDNRYYKASGTTKFTLQQGGGTNVSTTIKVANPVLILRVNNQLKNILPLNAKNYFSSTSIMNSLQNQAKEKIETQINQIGEIGPYDPMCAKFTFESDYSSLNFNFLSSGVMNCGAYLPNTKTKFLMHADECYIPDFYVKVYIDDPNVTASYNFNDNTYSANVSLVVDHVDIDFGWDILDILLGPIIIFIESILQDIHVSFNSDGQIITDSYASITQKLFNDIFPVSISGDDYLNSIINQTKWLFSDISVNTLINIRSGNILCDISYNKDKEIVGPVSGKVKALNTIQSLENQATTVSSGQSLNLAAMNRITLKPGFHAASGSSLLATCDIDTWPGFMPVYNGGNTANLNKTVQKTIPANGTNEKINEENQFSKTQVEDISKPLSFSLSQNYPNPFNPTTTIKYALKEDVKVSLKIYNALGQEVRTLVNEHQNAGFREIMWDGKNNKGSAVPSGVYIYRLVAGSNFVKSNKMMLMK